MARMGLLMVLLAAAGGCASGKGKGPESLRIDSARYAQAFDAALAAARRHDLTPTLRDRRAGVIDTAPSIAGSVLEPWRPGNASLGQAIDNTIAFQRWRARFEFAPAGAPGEAAISDDQADLLGVRRPGPDLVAFQGELELRVQVVVERAFTPGVRRSTWSRIDTTRATITRPATDPSAPTTGFWAPVSRDAAFEQRLLADVGRALAQNP